jgi:hypothetical protein
MHITTTQKHHRSLLHTPLAVTMTYLKCHFNFYVVWICYNEMVMTQYVPHTILLNYAIMLSSVAVQTLDTGTANCMLLLLLSLIS